MPRHKSVEQPPAGQRLSIERNGEVHDGTYTVDGPIVTVTSVLLGSRRARLGDSSSQALAKTMLLELIHEDERRRAEAANGR